MILRNVPVVALILGMDAGCECTVVGCVNGVRVHLESQPTTSYSVQARPIGSADTVQIFVCQTRGSDCGNDVYFFNMHPPEVEITVTVGSASKVTYIVNIAYTKSRPNGSDCPPECRDATVTAQVP